MTTFDKAHFPHLHGPSSQEKGDAVVSLPRLRSGSGSLQHITTIPDLRFEQSYLKSIAPYVQTRRISGAGDDSNSVEVIGVEWRNVMWITVRDQLISPLLQGAIW
ncbi:hypothetical protein EW145_g670 [Phellinidium pouzarii]|uniref:Uncharacterized protein n=1 Tax=Phellinidium pouzarii TaxID=167371 RepID=A0A4S4LN30_9AGAM|nr:hypothetical protein EW145_g670 [Phellinidium pouzarii]